MYVNGNMESIASIEYQDIDYLVGTTVFKKIIMTHLVCTFLSFSKICVNESWKVLYKL